MTLTSFGTVCSGIECAKLAVEAAGLDWRHAFTAETDKFANRLLAVRCSGVPNLGDMTKLISSGDIPNCDVLIAGTPCQSFSVAGKRGGIDDSRGNLALTLIGILDAMDRVRVEPAILVWENVPGILSHKENPFGVFLTALVGWAEPVPPFGKRGRWPASGLVHGPKRRASWRVLDAQWFGVPQRRKRLFVVASARTGGFDPSEVLLEREGGGGNPPPRRKAQQEVAKPLASCPEGGSGWRANTDTVENLIPVTVSTFDANYGKLQGASGQDLNHNHDHLVPTTCGSIRASTGGTDGNDAEQNRLVAFQCNGTNVGFNSGITGTLRQGNGHLTGGGPMVAFGGNRTSGPLEVATARSAHGGPSGRLDFETETFVVQPTVYRTNAAGQVNGQGDRSAALVSQTDPSTQILVSQLKAAHADLNVATDYTPYLTVRRLTPMECERLQGIPDNWTSLPGSDADGPRYRAVGNGFAVPVVAWILKRLGKHLKETAE